MLGRNGENEWASFAVRRTQMKPNQDEFRFLVGLGGKLSFIPAKLWNRYELFIESSREHYWPPMNADKRRWNESVFFIGGPNSFLAAGLSLTGSAAFPVGSSLGCRGHQVRSSHMPRQESAA
jgi:hypothetical protein